MLTMNISACGTGTTYQNDSAENVTCLLAVSAYCADLSKSGFAHECGVTGMSVHCCLLLNGARTPSCYLGLAFPGTNSLSSLQ